VEVLWFERGQKVRDLCAQSIAQAMNEAGYPEAESFFIALEPSGYYIAGKPLAQIADKPLAQDGSSDSA
ncbi:MAG: DUF1904 family protein, partial [Gammaproteobacteria bacterium]|nr:DUF1904 family protein [Gammaproteobacteria bacterium]